MSSSPLFGTGRDALMQHLESLFALAQVVTPNADQAVELVEATYRRAFETDEEFESGEEARTWLFRLMMNVRVEADRAARGEESSPVGADSAVASTPTAASSPRPRELADFRRRLAEELIDDAIPQAFAALTTEQRLFLMLCDVERMSCDDAGHVLGIEPAQACSKLDEARLALQQAIYAGATDVERRLLETGASADWRSAALRRMIESELVTTPPTLGPSVASLFGRRPRSGAAASPPPATATVTSAGSAPSELTWGDVLGKFGLVVAIIVVAGLLGYGFTRLASREPDRNLISLSARQAEFIEPTFRTSSAEQAERYIFDRLGIRVTVPTIDGATLQGLSIREVTESANVPVLLFQDVDSNRTLTVYVYTYAFLDRHERRLVLERDIRRQIEDEGNFDLHDLGREKALIWRNRDDIFIAITEGDAEELRGRIAFPS